DRHHAKRRAGRAQSWQQRTADRRADRGESRPATGRDPEGGAGPGRGETVVAAGAVAERARGARKGGAEERLTDESAAEAVRNDHEKESADRLRPLSLRP